MLLFIWDSNLENTMVCIRGHNKDFRAISGSEPAQDMGWFQLMACSSGSSSNSSPGYAAAVAAPAREQLWFPPHASGQSWSCQNCTVNHSCNYTENAAAASAWRRKTSRHGGRTPWWQQAKQIEANWVSSSPHSYSCHCLACPLGPEGPRSWAGHCPWPHPQHPGAQQPKESSCRGEIYPLGCMFDTLGLYYVGGQIRSQLSPSGSTICCCN